MRNEVFTTGRYSEVILKDTDGNRVASAIVKTGDLALLQEIGVSWSAFKHNATWYAQGSRNRSTVYMHRALMNPRPGLVVDHINHDGLDNRRENLRCVTVGENNKNRRGPAKHNRLGHLNVTMSHGYFIVEFRSNGKRCYRARFDTLDEAVADAVRMRGVLYGKEVANA